MSSRDDNQAPHDWTPPEAPTAAQAPEVASDEDIWEEMIEVGYTALAEASDARSYDPDESPASARECFAIALRAALAAQPKAAPVAEAPHPCSNGCQLNNTSFPKGVCGKCDFKEPYHD